MASFPPHIQNPHGHCSMEADSLPMRTSFSAHSRVILARNPLCLSFSTLFLTRIQPRWTRFMCEITNRPHVVEQLQVIGTHWETHTTQQRCHIQLVISSRVREGVGIGLFTWVYPLVPGNLTFLDTGDPGIRKAFSFFFPQKISLKSFHKGWETDVLKSGGT